MGSGTIAAVRILHTSDWHVGRTIRGRSRADEHRAVLADLARQAATHSVDLVVVSGDLFDLAAPVPESEQIVYRALLDLADVAPVVAVAGNHDNPRRLEAVTPLLDLGRVTMRSRIARADAGGVVDVPGAPAQVAVVPWQSQRGIVSASDLFARDAFENVVAYADRMRRILELLCEQLRDDRVGVLAGHLMVHGSETVGSERAIHSVFEYSLAAGAIPGSLSYVALGHLHRRQKVPASAPVWYSGSPLHLDFGEVGDRKGALLIEAEPGLPARVEPVDLAGGIPLVKLEGTLDQVLAAANELGEAHVKVELEESPRIGLADELRASIPGLVDVTIQKPEQPDRPAAAPRLGRPPVELFREYLEAKGRFDQDLLALFGELLSEAHEA